MALTSVIMRVCGWGGKWMALARCSATKPFPAQRTPTTMLCDTTSVLYNSIGTSGSRGRYHALRDVIGSIDRVAYPLPVWDGTTHKHEAARTNKKKKQGTGG